MPRGRGRGKGEGGVAVGGCRRDKAPSTEKNGIGETGITIEKTNKMAAATRTNGGGAQSLAGRCGRNKSGAGIPPGSCVSASFRRDSPSPGDGYFPPRSHQLPARLHPAPARRSSQTKLLGGDFHRPLSQPWCFFATWRHCRQSPAHLGNLNHRGKSDDAPQRDGRLPSLGLAPTRVSNLQRRAP